jgi:hypothetical protein
MTGPSDSEVQRGSGRNIPSEIPCRVVELPCERAISREYRLITGKPNSSGPCQGRTNTGRVIPWEVGSDELLDPVTTESESSRWRSLSQDKSIDAIRRRPS